MPPPNRTPQESSKNDWLDRLAHFNAHFGRFLRDVGGVALLALAAMSLMALWGITGGLLLTPWAAFLKLWLGWGSLFLVLALVLGGIFLLRRDNRPIHFGWIISFELASFLTLGLLAVFGGFDLDRVRLGKDGGIIGWGLATFFTTLAGSTWGVVVLVLLWLFFTLGAFNVWALVEARLLHLAETEPSLAPPSDAVDEDHAKPVSAPRREPRKRAQPLPPEFRTSLHPHEAKDEKPLKPQPRSDRLPPLNLFSTEQTSRPDERTINQTAGLIMKTLSEFGIPAQVVGYRVGPAVTQFAVQPGFIKKPGSNEDDAQQMKVRVAQIAALQKDLTLALSAERLRIEAPVPGKPYVGIEVPNSRTSVVRLRPILETEAFYKVASPLAIALGRDVSGQPLVADLMRMARPGPDSRESSP